MMHGLSAENIEMGSGAIALMLWQALQSEDVLYLADDEQAAEAIAGALAALAPAQNVVYLPASDALPGDRAPASPANIGRRLAALRQLRRLACTEGRANLATVMSGEAAARLYPAPSAFDAALPLLKPGDAIDSERFAQEMEAIGYIADDRVDEPGEIAVRGLVIDLFPADAGAPARVDIEDGRIVRIRRYDPVNQLSADDIDALEVGRVCEPDGQATGILSHLSPGRLYASPKADMRRQRFIRLATDVADREHAPLDAFDEDSWRDSIKAWSVVPHDGASLSGVPRFCEQRAPLAAMARFVSPLLDDARKLLLVGSERDIRFLRPRIQRKLTLEIESVSDLPAVLALPDGKAAALKAPIHRGAVTAQLVMIAASDLLGSRSRVVEDPDYAFAGFPSESADIRSGDVVVHEDHGVAKVMGLEPAPGSHSGEAIALEYAASTRRLVPIRDAGRIWRYGADADAVTLDRLDGASWQKRRADIDKAIAESAQALLALAAERSSCRAPVLDPDAARYERFVGGFPFNETADQARAIHAVRDDLASGQPMDRLVIGDVGFGKTEVALRAAALAALSGHQVVLAAPTTVLVRQHLQTFEQRFKGTSVKVVGLSRLSTTAEKKAAKAGLADGSIAIVVGTGAVMAKDVHFARLGLVIIDEEQRFGATDKARLRAHSDIHLLVMSATPIPRTLHRAMVGLQHISIIATPPARRQPIRTSVIEPDDMRIRAALLREHARKGQSFVIAPRISDLGAISALLKRLVPDMNLVEVHGKMPAADIDAAMVRFANGDGDVLLATNIIEAGLDVPRANTMIIWHADRFGLAQLHQLRGRVGRGQRRGQVLLLAQDDGLATRTMKRLRTLTTHAQLGAGFAISAADLDQRGAGDPLAETQAGHMKLIGVDLYQHLFEMALGQARGEPPSPPPPEIRLGGDAGLPRDWIPDIDIRLGLYLRIARARNDVALNAIEHELIDRFGALPPPADRLMIEARIAILAREADIAKVDAGPAAIALTPRDPNRPLPSGLEVKSKDGRWLLKPPDNKERTDYVTSLLENLADTTIHCD